jgi:hypothetical protein
MRAAVGPPSAQGIRLSVRPNRVTIPASRDRCRFSPALDGAVSIGPPGQRRGMIAATVGLISMVSDGISTSLPSGGWNESALICALMSVWPPLSIPTSWPVTRTAS